MRERIASCSCGQLGIRVRGEPLAVVLCHCLACQRRTGSAFAALAAFGAPYEVTGAATTWSRSGDAGARATFHFCPACGASVFHTEDDLPGEVTVAVGAFADPAFPPPQLSIHDCRRHPWVALPPGVDIHDRDPQ